jgi:hypothetical protein
MQVLATGAECWASSRALGSRVDPILPELENDQRAHFLAGMEREVSVLACRYAQHALVTREVACHCLGQPMTAMTPKGHWMALKYGNPLLPRPPLDVSCLLPAENRPWL